MQMIGRKVILCGDWVDGGRTEGGAGRVHDVLQAGFLDEALHVGNLGGDGGGGCSHLDLSHWR